MADWHIRLVQQKANLETELTKARAEIERLRFALGAAAVPLEVIAGQIADHPYEELSLKLQQHIVDEVIPIIRNAIRESTEPGRSAKSICTHAGVVSQDECPYCAGSGSDKHLFSDVP